MSDTGAVDTTKMSTRGQVIIPREIREYINAGEDTIFTVMPLDRETIIMKKLDKKKLISQFMEIRSRARKIGFQQINDEIAAVRRKGKGSS